MEQSEQWLTTKQSLDGNAEEAVGLLELKDLPAESNKKSAKRIKVFISHTGQDRPINCKEHFARPAYWFLKEVIGAEACFDDGHEELETGENVTEELTRHAWESTHALVILSPCFRKRCMPVQELNTFMERRRRKDGVRVMVTIWGDVDMKEYHEQVGELVRVAQSKTVNPVDFLLQTLWPKLLQVFQRGERSKPELERHLDMYIRSLRGTRVIIPPAFDQFAFRTREHLPLPIVDFPEQDYGDKAVRKGLTAACVGVNAIFRGMFDLLLDCNVRRVSIKTPPNKVLGGEEMDGKIGQMRFVKGTVSALFRDFGKATLTVGNKATNVDLTVVQLPDGAIKDLRDEHVPVRKGAIGIPLVVVLIGSGHYDSRLVSCFRRDYDLILIFDGKSLTQPTIADPRVRCMKHMTPRIWCALALCINGYCVSFWPENWARWVGFGCLLLSMVLSTPFLLAAGAGRTTHRSIEELDPWEVVGGDRNLRLDFANVVFFLLLSAVTAARGSPPETTMEGVARLGYYLVFATNLQYWWFLSVPVKSSKSILTWFSGSAILTGTLTTALGAPRLFLILIIAVIATTVVVDFLKELLGRLSPRLLLVYAPFYFFCPILLVVLTECTTTDNLAAMRQDGNFYDSSERLNASLVALVAIGLQLNLLQEGLGAVDDILHRGNQGWGTFRLHPAPSRVSLGSGSVSLSLGHHTNSHEVQVWDGISCLQGGLYR